MVASGVAEYNFDAFRFKPMPLTPIQQAVGFKVAEDVLDGLDLPDYLILEMIALGWQQQEIAELLSIDPSWVSIRLKQIRVLLADGQLHKLLQIRQHVKQIVRGEPS